MNIKKSRITILILLLLTIVMLAACSGDKPAETPASTPDASQTAPEPAATVPAAQTTAPESTTPPSQESKPAESAAEQTPAAQPAAETTPAPAIETATTKPVEAKTTPQAVEAPAQAATEASSGSQSSYKGVLAKPIAEQPVLLTSSGQSADVQMVKVLLDRAEIKYVINSVVKPEEMKDVKTLILAVGGSSKGLGAAGIDAEDELDRTKAVIAKAKELNLKIISLHIGGEARRGELSDKFINAAIPSSDYVIVVEDGNKDGLFTKLIDANSIPMDKVKKITEAIEPLKSAFK